MNDFIQQVRSVIPAVEQRLRNFVENSSCGYETFGKEVETPAINILLQELENKNLIYSPKLASNKNEFPDLGAIKNAGNVNVAIDVKSSNHSGIKKGVWTKQTTPANDLGTFKTLPEHFKEWGGENIYFLWVHYDFTPTKREIVKVEFDSFYRFVGLNSDNRIKYRISDGKIRPRTYLQQPFFHNFNEFYDCLKITEAHRSEKIIFREYNSLDLSRQSAIIEKLQANFTDTYR